MTLKRKGFGKSSKADLQILLLWLAVKSVIKCIVNYARKIWHHNPVSVLIERHRRLYFVEEYREDIIKPSMKEKLTDIFLTDNKRRRRLLTWVQMKVKDPPVFDFSSCWQDGIMLCSLLECVYPGICPSYNLLSSDHRVKNCRLGMKLAYKYLYVPMDILSPEEMAIAGKDTETKIVQYISIIKWASQNIKKEKWSSLHKSLIAAKAGRCFTKGSGLGNGIVGRRSKFSIIVSDTIGAFNLLVEIRGPDNEYYGERIVSLHQALGLIDRPVLVDSTAGPQQNNEALKYMEDCAGNTFIRRTIPHTFDVNAMVGSILMDIQSGEEGTFFVTFIPHRAGIHTVTVKWQNYHVEGSPFRVKVYRASNISIKGLRNAQEKRVIFNSISFETLDDVGTDSNDRSTEDADMPETMEARANHVTTAKTKQYRKGKKLTVTRRRVLRKILSRNGEDIVIEKSISPSLSRQSSFTDPSDQTDDEVIRSKEAETRAKLNVVKESSREYVLQNERDMEACIKATGGNIIKSTNRSQTGQNISNIKENIRPEDKSKTLGDCDDEDTRKQLKNKMSRSLKNNIQNVQSSKQLVCMNAELKIDYTIKGDIKQIETAAAAKMNSSSGNNDVEKRAARRTMSDTLVYQPRRDVVSQMSKNSRKYSSCDTDESDSSHKQKSKDKETKVENESPTLKILHSSSMKKSCVYISQRALTHTLSGTSNEPTEDTVHVNLKPKKKAHITRSLPIVRQTWKVIDDKDNTDRFSVNTLLKCLKTADTFSCEKKKLSPSSEENSDGDDMVKSDEVFPKYWTKQCDFQQKKKMADDIEIGGRKSLQIKEENERINVSGAKNNKSESFLTSNAKTTEKNDLLKGTIDDTKNVSIYNNVTNRAFAKKSEKKNGMENVVIRPSHKGSLQRQDSFFIQKSSSDSTDSERNCSFNAKPNKQYARETDAFKSIYIHKNMGKHMYNTSNVHIVVPKVKMDRTTQVASDEILKETGWDLLLNSTRLIMRKIGIKVPTSFVSNTNNDSKSTAAETNETATTNQPCSSVCMSISADSIMIPNDLRCPFGDQNVGAHLMDGNLDNASLETRNERKTNDNVSAWIEHNRNSINQLLLRPVRQSTFETTDSGFMEELGAGYLRWARNSVPLVRATNGHMILHRRPYEGQITYDPNLVRGGTTQEIAPNNPNPRSGRDERKYDKNKIPNIPHGRRHHPVREESCSLSDSELRLRSLPGTKQSFRRHNTDKLSKTLDDIDTTADKTVAGKIRVLALNKLPKWNSQTSRGSFDSTDDENNLSLNRPNSDISLRRTVNSKYPTNLIPDDVPNSPILAVNSTSLEDGYFGFGISNIDRNDLLSELDSFQNICCGTTDEDSDVSTTTKQNQLFVGNTNSSTVDSISTQQKKNTRHGRDMATRDIHAVENGHRGTSQSIALSASQNAVKSDDINLCDEVFFSALCEVRLLEDLMQATDSECSTEWQTILGEPKQQRPRCRVTGAGIVCGYVGIQNNFQIWVEHAENGAVSVSIRGPRPHAVTETSVIYTGDNLYEVVYQVTSPGYYIITVKLDDQSVTESPFKCNVTM